MHRLCFLILAVLSLPQMSWGQSVQSDITSSRVRCANGAAARHACNGIDLLSYLPKGTLDATARWVNDIWGWTDPKTKREYALVGTSKSVAFVDVTDPVNPIYLGKLPGHASERNRLWRDMKVYKDHMFVVVDGGRNDGMQVFDLRQLRSPPSVPKDWTATAHYDGIRSAHNIAINEETGFAYVTASWINTASEQGRKDTCNGPGLHIVNIQDPVKPVYAGCLWDTGNTSGLWNKGYTHDTQCVIYRGPDAKYRGREICINSNEQLIQIADVTDKKNPVTVGTATYPNVAYAHQGWFTEDQRYFLMNDELDEKHYRVENTRMIIWDMEELEDPVHHSSFFFPTKNTDHNLYVHGNYVYAANYTTGLRILDISNINKPREIAFFDTHPRTDEKGYDGAWSSYRFPRSGTTIVSSDPDGLFVLDPTTVNIPLHTETSATVPERFTLSPAYPNPFNPITSTTLSLPNQTAVRVEVLDVLGRSVRVLRDEVLPAGNHTLTFDAGQLPSGSYYIQVQTEQHTDGTRVVLLK